MFSLLYNYWRQFFFVFLSLRLMDIFTLCRNLDCHPFHFRTLKISIYQMLAFTFSFEKHLVLSLFLLYCWSKVFSHLFFTYFLLVFRSFTLMFLSVLFFTLWVYFSLIYRASWFCGLILLVNFDKISATPN